MAKINGYARYIAIGKHHFSRQVACIARAVARISWLALFFSLSWGGFAQEVTTGTNNPTVAWDAATDVRVVGFFLKHGVVGGSTTNVVDVSSATNYTITTLSVGTTNFIFATSYDAYGNESEPSTVLYYQQTSSSPAVVAPAINSQPSNQTVVQGAGAAFSVAASGTAPLYYQWYKSGVAISGATGSSLVFSSAQSADAASYSVIVSNSAGSTTSSTASLTVNVPPSITSQPSSYTVNQGTNVTFSVAASGTAPLYYQWYKGGVAVSGATSSTLALSNVQSSNAGTYTVIVTNLAGTVTSSSATLTVNVPPAITTQPSSYTVNQGTNVTFSVAASGTATLYYQWYKGGVAVSGATGSSLVLSSVQSADAGSYSVIVTNMAGTVTSSSATLTVNVPPSITTQPSSYTVVQGTNVTFSVAASGTATLYYQWYKSGVAVSGATGSSLVLSSVQSADAGSYTVIVTNMAGMVTSSAASLTVNVPPAITTQPSSYTVNQGTNVTFSVAASGTATLYYQWYKGGVAVSGATGATLTLNNVQSSHAGSYSVMVTNMAGTVTSSSATLTVNVPPSITTQPASLTVVQGSNAMFTVAVTGTLPLSYQWLKNGASISGANSATLSLLYVQASDVATYSVVVTNVAGQATSTAAALAVNIPPTITTHPASIVSAQGSNVTFSVAASGTTPLSYQWYKNGTSVSGATSATLALNNVQSANAGSYYAIVTNVAGTITSSTATLTVNNAPVFTSQPADVVSAQGSNVSFTVVVSGATPLNYQWYKDGVEISHATNASLILANVQTDDEGSYYVFASNVAGNATSASATLTVQNAPVITTEPVDVVVVAGNSATLSLAASGASPLIYQWYKNGLPLATATNAALSYAAVEATHSGAYFATVSNMVGVVTSQVAQVTVNVPPAITTQPVSVTAILGSEVTFSVAANGTSPLSYQWFKNGDAIAAATNSVLAIGAVQVSDAGSYAVMVANAAGTTSSSSAALAVIVPPSINVQPAGLTVLQGSNVTLSVVADGTAPLSYQWSKDGAALSGARSASLSLNNVQAADAGAYAVSVANAAGTVVSGTAHLVVNVPPSITSQPASFAAIQGSNVTFSVIAAGTAPLSYQWYKDGAVLSGASSAMLALSSVQVVDAGAYSVVVSNLAGQVASSAATLTVGVPPAITQQPAGLVAVQGSNVTFNVSATGTAPLSYQWYKDGVALAKATNASLTLANVQSVDAATYTVTVSNSAGARNSTGATLIVNLPPVITAQPASMIAVRGNNVTLSVGVTGTAPLSYQWYKDGGAINGANSATLAMLNVQTADAGSYSVTVSNVASQVSSALATLTVNILPTISTQPASVVSAQGSNVTFSVVADGTAPLSYQWFKNGLAITGATAANLNLSNVQSANEGAYSVIVSNPAGTVTSALATLTVNNAPSIAVPPTSLVVAKGSNATFSVIATGAAPLSYQWYKDGVAIGGATSAVLTINAVQLSQAGVYTVVVSNSISSITSSAASLTVNDAPTILTQPTDVVALKDANVTFTVSAGGAAPLTYQWYKDGIAINGAVSASLSLPSVQAAQAGTYYVIVNNTVGSATSKIVQLTVNVAPTISAQPAGMTVVQGTNVNFSVTAAGTAPLAYQWFKDGVAISGAINAVLALNNVQSAQAGTYVVMVSNVAGIVTSSGASLAVNVPPSIQTQPASLAAVAGTNAIFTVVATGTAPLTYQWYKDGVVLSGATSSTLVLSGVKATDAGKYLVKVSNAAGSLNSAEAILSVSSAPVFVTQPASLTAAPGGVASFTATVVGTAPLAYQWSKNGSAISGATGATLTLNNVQTNDAGSYVLVASNSVGFATSLAATLTVNSLPVITAQPASLSAVQGSNVTFKVAATGTAPLSYQWYKNGNLIAGATSATLSLSGVQSVDAGTYTVMVSNPVGQATSTGATLVIQYPPVVVTQPVSQSVVLGTNVDFTVVVGGTQPLTYQWFKNNVALAGANSATLGLRQVQATDAAAYKVVVSNLVGSVTSASVTLTVLNPPVITAQPSSLTVNPSANATFKVVATGAAPLTYQWYKDGSLLSGATAQSLVLSKVQSADAGQYRVMVSNTAGSVASEAATLTVNQAPVIVEQPASLSVVQGSSAAFSVTANGTDPMYYQWRANGAKIAGATNAIFNLAKVQSSNAVNYSVVITNVVGSVTSAVASLTVIVPPVFTTQPASQAVTVGSDAVFSAGATGTAPLTWQWRKNGVDLPGETSSQLVVANAQAANAGDYTVVVSNAAAVVASQTATLAVGLAPVIAQSPASQTAILGSSARFSVAATGTAPLTYRWLKDGAIIAGATNAEYVLSGVVAADTAGYSVIVANAFGSAASASASLAVVIPPSITSQPANASGRQGYSATFSVTASGTAPMTYQWLRDGVKIAAATNRTYTIPSVQWADGNASFSVVVANAGGSVTSGSAGLTINGPPVITAQPQNTEAVTGGSATFSVSVVGTSPMTYRWMKNGIYLAGATNATFTLANVSMDNAGSYSVRIQNSLGTTNSTAATLTVTAGLPTVKFALQVQGADASSLTVTGGLAPVLAWNAAPSPYTGYYVFLGTADDVTNRFNLGTTNRVQLTGLLPGGVYYVSVAAYTPDGRMSNPSETIAYTPEFTSPVLRTVNGQAVSEQVISSSAAPTLAWDASPETTTAGYYVYFGTAGGEASRFDAGLATSLTLTNLATGVTNVLFVTAYNALGLESAASAVAQCVRLAKPAGDPNPTPSLTVQPNGTGTSAVTLRFATVLGEGYVIQVSTNLRDWSDVVAVPAATTTETEFTDAEASSFNMRFYRVITKP